MNVKQKKLGVFFTVLIFGRLMFGGDIGPVETLYKSPVNGSIAPAYIIKFMLPPIESGLIREIDEVRKEYVWFMRSV